jgi:GT2 family glycosyltransferase
MLGLEVEQVMKLSIVIVSWNTRELLRTCLNTVRAEMDDASNLLANDTEVFLVDNDSKDASAQMVADDFPWVRLIANKDNLGFAKANNQAINICTGRLILLLNPDTEVKPGALKTLIDFLDAHPKAGIVAPQLINTDGSVQRSCRAFPTFNGMVYELMGLSKIFPDQPRFREYKMLDWNHDDEREVDQPEGACLMLKREVIEQVGTLDEGFWMLFEEVDWCYRIKQQGWQIWFTPRAKVVHHYGQSIKQVKAKMILSSHRGLYRFWKKHYRKGRWYMDAPAYLGLMGLAYFRIASFHLRGGKQIAPKST